MNYVKNTSYRICPFTYETPQGEFYTYSCIKDLIKTCSLDRYSIVKCQTVGILQSIAGKFYLSEIQSKTPLVNELEMIRVSTVYLKNSPPSTVIPYPVQMFGTLQWKNRPVIFAKIIQVMNPGLATRVQDCLNEVSKKYIASHSACKLTDS